MFAGAPTLLCTALPTPTTFPGSSWAADVGAGATLSLTMPHTQGT